MGQGACVQRKELLKTDSFLFAKVWEHHIISFHSFFHNKMFGNMFFKTVFHNNNFIIIINIYNTINALILTFHNSNKKHGILEVSAFLRRLGEFPLFNQIMQVGFYILYHCLFFYIDTV